MSFLYRFSTSNLCYLYRRLGGRKIKSSEPVSIQVLGARFQSIVVNRGNHGFPVDLGDRKFLFFNDLVPIGRVPNPGGKAVLSGQHFFWNIAIVQSNNFVSRELPGQLSLKILDNASLLSPPGIWTKHWITRGLAAVIHKDWNALSVKGSPDAFQPIRITDFGMNSGIIQRSHADIVLGQGLEEFVGLAQGKDGIVQQRHLVKFNVFQSSECIAPQAHVVPIVHRH
mmetsp:Transcript_21990/g.45239  ORF Transcript_21990/g.45239 Transcript_21990/m.45239 type:complete len:226 (+) Transcript_21990:1-678(+)